MQDVDFMRLALEQAELAAKVGEVPVGAVLVRHGMVVAVGHNRVVATSDPTAHAEIVVMRQAAADARNYRLDDCELFVTLEPCAMCSGAILNARLKRVVFGASEPKTGAGGSVINLFAESRLNHHTALQGGVLASNAARLMQQFFGGRRFEQRLEIGRPDRLRDDAVRTPDAAFDGLPDYPWPPHYIADLPSLAGLRMHYLDVSGKALESDADAHLYSHTGGSITFLCLHRWAGWSYRFRSLLPYLMRRGHRIVVPDLIGFGKSDKPKRPAFHTLEQHRNILLELVERLDLGRIVLLMEKPGSLLGMSLPPKAAERYLGLRCIDPEKPSFGGWFPMSSGFGILEKICDPVCLDVTHRKQVHLAIAKTQKLAGPADAIPFPNKGYRAGLHVNAEADQGINSPIAKTLRQTISPFWLGCSDASEQ